MSAYFIIFHPLAEKEYLESIEWYENNLINLGEEFIKEVEQVIELIELQPNIFPVKKAKKREGVVNRFPYVVIYQVFEKQHLIHILSVFNTNRNPKYKRR